MTLRPKAGVGCRTPQSCQWQYPPHIMGRSATTLVLATVAVLLCCVFVEVTADSAGDYDLPGPGLAYGGIPYGSVSGNVAQYFHRGGATYNYKSGISRGFNGNTYDFYSRDFD